MNDDSTTDALRASPAPAAARALRILNLLAQDPRTPQSLTAIASHLSAAKSSILNVCLVLEGAGFVEKIPGGYVLGRRVGELGGAYVRRFDVVRLFYRLADQSRPLHDELVQLGILIGPDVLYLARKEASRSTLRLTAGIGESLPAASTAIGRVLLAGMDEAEVIALVGSAPLPRFTEYSISTIDELLADLEQVRDRGYAVDRGGVFPNVTGVALALARAPGERDLALSTSIVDPERARDVGPLAHALGELADALTNPMVHPPGSARE